MFFYRLSARTGLSHRAGWNYISPERMGIVLTYSHLYQPYVKCDWLEATC